MSDDRNLTDTDVEAIVAELKRQLVADFQLEVGKGMLGWVKKVFWWLLLIAAVYGMADGAIKLPGVTLAASKG